MHVNTGGKGPTQNTREMESVRGSLDPSSSDGDDEDDESGDE